MVLLGVPPAGVFTFFLAGCGRQAHDPRRSHGAARHPGRHDGDAPVAAGHVPAEPRRAAHRPAQDDLGRASSRLSSRCRSPCCSRFFLPRSGQTITKAAPWIFVAAAVAIAYFSAGRWASVAALIPFVLVIVALQGLTAKIRREAEHQLLPGHRHRPAGRRPLFGSLARRPGADAA